MMSDLLDFARGPALQVSVMIFIFGVLYRLISLFLTPKNFIASPARENVKGAFGAGVGEIMRRMVPDKEYLRKEMFAFLNGWAFHIGLAITVFGLAGHIMFFKKILGFGWWNLPSNFVMLAGVITLFSLVASLAHRLTDPVLHKLSTLDDYLSGGLTVLPVATGLLATMHLGLRYETLIAIHILSVCIFLIYFPFGKLMHAFLVFVTRAKTGVEMARKGVKL